MGYVRTTGLLAGAVVAAVAAFAPLPAAGFATPVVPDEPVELQQHPQPWLGAIGWTLAAVDAVQVPAMIGIADSGLAAASEDFYGGDLVTADTSADCLGGTAVPATTPVRVDDGFGHGTAIASLAAAPINGVGMVGVSPRSQLAVVRFTRKQEINDAGATACALGWLARVAGAFPLVANLSFGFPATATVRAATTRLVRRRALIVAATGNVTAEVRSGVDYPASAQHTLAVADTGLGVGRSGLQVDLVAPGSGLRVPLAGAPNAYATDSGTSYSTALVSGVAALVWNGAAGIDDPQAVGFMLRVGATVPPETKPRFDGRWHGPRLGFGQVSLSGALDVTPPVVDEQEPDDDAAHRWPFRCPRIGKCLLHGVVVRTDDARDLWNVDTRLKRATCPRRPVIAGRYATVGGVRVVCKAAGAHLLLTVSLLGATAINAYTLRVR
jgi:hypothetical protein